jgi:hypothetical protein
MASILETFYFLFESDAEKLDKGLKESERKSESLERSLKDTDAAAGMVGGSLLKVAGAVGAALGGFLAFGAVKATVLETANAIDALGDAAAALDLPVEELSAYSMAATAVDGSQEGFISSLNTLNTGLNSIATKGKGLMLPFLKELGLSMDDVKKGAKDPLFALVQMSDQFAKLSKAEAAGLGAKIGLDQGTINLLAQGRHGIEELIRRQKELGVVTTLDAEEAGKFDLAMKEWNATFEDVKRKFVVTLLPPITWFFDKLRTIVSWMADHKTVVVSFFGAVAAMLIGVYAPAAFTAAAATWAMLAPYIAIGAAIAAFAAIVALVVDDLYNFQNGKDSVIGEIAKKWPIVGDLIHDFGRRLAWAMAAVEAFGRFFVDLIEEGPIVALQNLGGAFNTLINDIAERYPLVGVVFSTATNVMSSAIERVAGVWDWLVDKVSKGIALFMRGVEMLKSVTNAGARLFGFDEPFSAKRSEAEPPARQPSAGKRHNDLKAGAEPRGVLDTRTGNVKPLPQPAFVDTKTASAVSAGKTSLAATSSPIAAQTSNSITNSNTSRTVIKETRVQTGPIKVETQANNGPQVAAALGQELGTHLRGAIDQNDDGVLA